MAAAQADGEAGGHAASPSGWNLELLPDQGAAGSGGGGQRQYQSSAATRTRLPQPQLPAIESPTAGRHENRIRRFSESRVKRILCHFLAKSQLVIDDAALGQPLLDTLPERIPHIHAGGLDSAALEGTQPLLEELIEGLFLPVLSEPQRLGGIQIAHHGDELLLLAQVNLVHSHVAQGRLLTTFRPTLEIAQIDGPHGVR